MKFKALIVFSILGLAIGCLGQIGQLPGRSAYGIHEYSADEVIGVTNRLGANTTNFPNAIINLTRYDEVGLMAGFQGAGLATQPVTYRLRYSLDGTNFGSGSVASWVVSQNSTNPVVAVTNLYVGVTGYLQVYSIENGSTTNQMTNHFLKISTKPTRFGIR